MPDPVNLRLHRKRKARAAQEAEAAANRAAFGQPKALREVGLRQRERSAGLLDGHKRERSGGEDGAS